MDDQVVSACYWTWSLSPTLYSNEPYNNHSGHRAPLQPPEDELPTELECYAVAGGGGKEDKEEIENISIDYFFEHKIWPLKLPWIEVFASSAAEEVLRIGNFI